MITKIFKIFFFFLLLINFNAADARAKILISRYENWKHPVEKVFKKYDMSLYKVHYSKDGTCPTFYAQFKYSPNSKVKNPIDYKQVYAELFKANYNFPYALVDEKENLKINVGWQDATKENISVSTAKPSSLSTCRGNNHANIDDDADFDKFIITPQLKEKILKSQYKAPLQRKDGKQFIAYLYAENEQITHEKQISCEEEKLETLTVYNGNYYIYLYDPHSDSFFPGRIEPFPANYKINMNKKTNFFSLKDPQNNQSDIILLSQMGSCIGDDYEAYGFTENHQFLKQYPFFLKKKYKQFNGRITNQKENNKVIVYTSLEDYSLEKMYLSLAELGIIKLQAITKN